MTVSDFVSVLEKHLGKTATREYVPMPKTGDVPFTHADVSRAASELGYEPRTSLDEGLRAFAEWYLDFCGERVRGDSGVQAELKETKLKETHVCGGRLVIIAIFI